MNPPIHKLQPEVRAIVSILIYAPRSLEPSGQGNRSHMENKPAIGNITDSRGTEWELSMDISYICEGDCATLTPRLLREFKGR
jgi:hypothetical protein